MYAPSISIVASSARLGKTGLPCNFHLEMFAQQLLLLLLLRLGWKALPRLVRSQECSKSDRKNAGVKICQALLCLLTHMLHTCQASASADLSRLRKVRVYVALTDAGHHPNTSPSSGGVGQPKLPSDSVSGSHREQDLRLRKLTLRLVFISPGPGSVGSCCPLEVLVCWTGHF